MLLTSWDKFCWGCRFCISTNRFIGILKVITFWWEKMEVSRWLILDLLFNWRRSRKIGNQWLEHLPGWLLSSSRNSCTTNLLMCGRWELLLLSWQKESLLSSDYRPWRLCISYQRRKRIDSRRPTFRLSTVILLRNVWRRTSKRDGR